MNKVRILFNSCSLDAMLATALVVEAIKKTETEDLKYSIETVPHSPVNYVAPNSEYDFVFCIGAYLNCIELEEENNRTKNMFYISYGYDLHVETLKKVLGDDANIFTPNYMWGKEIEQFDKFVNSYSPCLSKMIVQVLKRYFTKPSAADILITSEEREEDSVRKNLLSAIEKYCQNEKLEAHELNFIHKNIDGITSAAHNATIMEYNPMNDEDIAFKNSARTTKVRSIITKGLSAQLYGNQKSSLLVQTINCSEDYISDLIRLISFATDSIVMYQDIKHARQWWIYSKNSAIGENIASMIPHYRIHRDSNIIYLVSDMPSMLSK